MLPRSLLSAVLLFTCVSSARAGEPSTRAADARPPDARSAVERSLPFLETGGVTWIKEKGCASCHNVTFLVWSHTAARDRGISVDEHKLAEWTDWTRKFSKSKPDGVVE